jgi:CRP-like cAMP-binding protein
VFQLSRASLAQVLARNSRAREFAFRELAARIKALSAKYEDRVFLDVPGRLAKYLLELRRVRDDVPITQNDLAAAIGSTRVTVNKLLADFERRGLVRIERRRVHVIDDSALAAETRR